MKARWIILMGCVLLGGCASTPPPQPSIFQKRQVESKLVQGNYNNVFPAIMTVLQDSDFNIDQASKDSGFIAATRMHDLSSSQKFWGQFWQGVQAKKGDEWKLTCVIEPKTLTECSLRLTITALAYNLAGQNTDAEPVDDPTVIQNFLDQIQTEVERREAINGTDSASMGAATPTTAPVTTPAAAPDVNGANTTGAVPKTN
jgi:hypothetical protein